MNKNYRALMAIEKILRKAKAFDSDAELVPRIISVAAYFDAYDLRRGVVGYSYLDGINALADLSELMKVGHIKYTIKKDFFLGNKKKDEVFVVFGLGGVSEYDGLSIDWIDDRIKDAIEAEVKNGK